MYQPQHTELTSRTCVKICSQRGALRYLTAAKTTAWVSAVSSHAIVRHSKTAYNVHVGLTHSLLIIIYDQVYANNTLTYKLSNIT